MGNQKGAALIVVLSLLTISLMVGLSSMQSSQIDERLAGNYKAQSQAQMAAEKGASVGLNSSSRVYLPADEIDSFADFDSKAFVDLGGRGVLSYRYYYLEKEALEKVRDSGWIPDFILPGEDFFILSQGRVSDSRGDVDRFVVVGVSEDTSFSSSLEGVFTCFGLKCSVSESTEESLLGEDHALPDSFNCTGNSCRTNPIEDRDVSLDLEAFVHHAPEDSGYSSKRAGWEILIKYLRSPDASFSSGKIEYASSRNAPSVIEITGSVRLNGNNPTSGVIVVRDGGVLEKANGTAHHEGLIIVEEGGEIDIGTGTFNLYGGVLKLKDDDGDSGENEGYDLSVGGNSYFRYSSSALVNAEAVFGGVPKTWLDL